MIPEKKTLKYKPKLQPKNPSVESMTTLVNSLRTSAAFYKQLIKTVHNFFKQNSKNILHEQSKFKNSSKDEILNYIASIFVEGIYQDINKLNSRFHDKKSTMQYVLENFYNKKQTIDNVFPKKNILTRPLHFKNLIKYKCNTIAQDIAKTLNPMHIEHNLDLLLYAINLGNNDIATVLIELIPPANLHTALQLSVDTKNTAIETRLKIKISNIHSQHKNGSNQSIFTQYPRNFSQNNQPAIQPSQTFFSCEKSIPTIFVGLILFFIYRHYKFLQHKPASQPFSNTPKPNTPQDTSSRPGPKQLSKATAPAPYKHGCNLPSTTSNTTSKCPPNRKSPSKKNYPTIQQNNDEENVDIYFKEKKKYIPIPQDSDEYKYVKEVTEIRNQKFLKNNRNHKGCEYKLRMKGRILTNECSLNGRRRIYIKAIYGDNKKLNDIFPRLRTRTMKNHQTRQYRQVVSSIN